MNFADRLKDKYIVRLDELIAAGETMPMEKHSSVVGYKYLSGESTSKHYDTARWPEFVEWRTSCIAILDQVVPATSLLRRTVGEMHRFGANPSQVQCACGFLRSVKKELENGLFDSLAREIEAEILSDYLDQAAAVLAGPKDEQNHIAAAVIVGSALERCLRSICFSLAPEEPVFTEKGRPLGMDALIDSLKKRKVFNEVRAKELRTWAALRNAAAHGHFEQFNRSQVENMVAGVVGFVREHAK